MSNNPIRVLVTFPDGRRRHCYPSCNAADTALGLPPGTVWRLAANGNPYRYLHRQHAHLIGIRVQPVIPISPGHTYSRSAKAVLAYLPGGTVRRFQSVARATRAMGLGCHTIRDLIDSGQPYHPRRTDRRSRCPQGTTFDLADPTP